MSLICNHPRKQRIDKNFVLCLSCGDSFVDMKNIRNKRVEDFARESKHNVSVDFDRHFSNTIPVYAKQSSTGNEYYMDRAGKNRVIVNRQTGNAGAVKIRAKINGSTRTIEQSVLSRLLRDMRAIRVDKRVFYSSIS